MRPRITLLTHGFGPYRVPLWNALAELSDLKIVFLSEKEKHRSWDVDISVLKARVATIKSLQISLRSVDWALNLSYRKVKKALSETPADVLILSGYESPGFWAARAWANKKKIPIVLWQVSTSLSSRTKGNRLIDGIKRRFVASCGAFYVTSSLSAEYLAYFGAPREKIIVGSNIPDVKRFADSARLGEPDVPTLLYVGQFIERKGIIEMLESLATLLDLNWKLVLSGDGPLKDKLTGLITELGLGGRLSFTGYVQQNDLDSVYRTADILVFPSLREAWGLVVNEALLSGLYVVGSDRAAASVELITPGVNGEIVNPLDRTGFSNALRRAIKNLPYDRAGIRKTVEDLTPENEAAKIMKAVDIALGAGGS